MNTMPNTEQLEQLVKARQLILANLLARFLSFPGAMSNAACLDYNIASEFIQIGDRSTPVLCIEFNWDTTGQFTEEEMPGVHGENSVTLSAADDLDVDDLEHLQLFMNTLEAYAAAELREAQEKAALKQRLKETFTEEELKKLGIKAPKD